MKFRRTIDIEQILKLKSIFLFGPRWTGKSTVLQDRFQNRSLYLNLLDRATFKEISADPNSFQQKVRFYLTREAEKTDSLVYIIVDEIQKLPELLNDVHLLIEEDKRLRFVLTGSSARKLKKEGINLLGGRASWRQLYPLVYTEWKDHSEIMSLTKAIQYGGLPQVLLSLDPQRELKDYVGLYLKEEIQAEGIARNIEAFSRFLDVAAFTNAEQVNFENVGNDAQVPSRTVREYYQILVDTLIGTLLPPYQKTKTRKAVATPKFYFFDTGVNHALLGRWSIKRGTPEYGKAIEHYVFTEIRAAIEYFEKDLQLYFWRSTSKLEVDFIISEHEKPLLAIEVKGCGQISSKDLKGLHALSEDFPTLRKIIVCNEIHPRLLDDQTEVLPLEYFLNALWNSQIL